MCWKGKNSNYQEISDFVDSHLESEELKEFEERLANVNLLDFRIYECRYKEKKTFVAIAKKLDLDSTARIAESLNATSLAIQIYFNIVD